MKIKPGIACRGPSATVLELLVERSPLDPPIASATIASWFIDAPGQSSAWRNYLLSIAHLRDIPGEPPAKIRAVGATHELLLMAMDPS